MLPFSRDQIAGLWTQTQQSQVQKPSIPEVLQTRSEVVRGGSSQRFSRMPQGNWFAGMLVCFLSEMEDCILSAFPEKHGNECRRCRPIPLMALGKLRAGLAPWLRGAGPKPTLLEPAWEPCGEELCRPWHIFWLPEAEGPFPCRVSR